LDDLIADAPSVIDRTDPKQVAFFDKYFEVRRKLLDDYERNGMPREMELRTIVDADMPDVRAAILRMTWQFLVAAEDETFVTADNPVHTLKGGVGFTKPYSELTFPVSSRVVLIGSYRDVGAGYVPAKYDVVKEVNRRVIAAAKTFAYASRKRAWIITIMKKKFHHFNLFYPAPELSAPLVV
jgi:hypothetical protein